jgi:hypothetical protein
MMVAKIGGRLRKRQSHESSAKVGFIELRRLWAELSNLYRRRLRSMGG